MSKQVIFLIMLILITLTNSTLAANESLDVTGLTVYTIFRAPLFESENLSKSYLNSERYCGSLIPSCYEVNEKYGDVKGFINDTISKYPNNCSSWSGAGIDCITPGLMCYEGNVRFSYDGYWVIGQKQVIADRQDNTLHLHETKDRVKEAKDEIWNRYESFRTRINITDSGKVLVLIHFNWINPHRISIDNITSEKEGRYSVVNSTNYKEVFCDFLNIEPRERNLQVIEYISQSRNKPNYRYLIRNDEKVNDFYGEIIVIDGSIDIEYSSLIEHLFYSLDYLRYGREFIEDYANKIKSNSTSLNANITDIKRELLNKTDNNRFDYKERLRYLESNRSIILEKNVDSVRKIENELYLIERYYGRVYELFFSAPFSRTFGSMLYDSEIKSHLEQLSAIIEDIKKDMSQNNKLQQETTQLYYSELDSARNEQAIRETHMDNLVMTCLALLSAILTIVFTLNLIPIQNAVEKYTPEVLSELTRHLSINIKGLRIDCIYLGIFILMVILMGLWTFGAISDSGLWHIILFFIFIFCFVLVYFLYNRTVNLINPSYIISRVRKKAVDDIIDLSEYSGLKKSAETNISTLSDIAIKSIQREDIRVAKECMYALDDILSNYLFSGKKVRVMLPILNQYHRILEYGLKKGDESRFILVGLLNRIPESVTYSMPHFKNDSQKEEWISYLVDEEYPHYLTYLFETNKLILDNDDFELFKEEISMFTFSHQLQLSHSKNSGDKLDLGQIFWRKIRVVFFAIGAYILFKEKEGRINAEKYLLEFWEHTKRSDAIWAGEPPITYDIKYLTEQLFWGGENKSHWWHNYDFGYFQGSKDYIYKYYILLLTYLRNIEKRELDISFSERTPEYELNRVYMFLDRFISEKKELVKHCDLLTKEADNWNKLLPPREEPNKRGKLQKVDAKKYLKNTREWINSKSKEFEKKKREIEGILPLDPEKVVRCREKIMEGYSDRSEIEELIEVDKFDEKRDEEPEFLQLAVRPLTPKYCFIKSANVSCDMIWSDNGRIIAAGEIKHLIKRISEEKEIRKYKIKPETNIKVIYKEIEDILTELMEEGFSGLNILVPQQLEFKFEKDSELLKKLTWSNGKTFLKINGGKFRLFSRGDLEDIILLDKSAGLWVFKPDESTGGRLQIKIEEYEKDKSEVDVLVRTVITFKILKPDGMSIIELGKNLMKKEGNSSASIQ